MKPQILALQGISDDSQAKVTLDCQGQLKILMSGGINLVPALRSQGWPIDSILLAPEDNHQQYTVKKAALLLNEISDPDSHSIALRKAQQVRQQFPDLYCLNEPAAVAETTRDQVSAKLSTIPGVQMPKTCRLQVTHPQLVAVLMGSEFSGSVLLRKAGTHNGISTVLLKSPENLDPLHCLALDGSDFYMTEFVNFQSPDGLYRKYRFTIVGDEIFLRHLFIADQWNIHLPSSWPYMQAHPELIVEEEQAIAQFPYQLKSQVSDRILAIRDRLQLDYFSIDASLAENGDLIIFEANANMNILVNNRPLPNAQEAVIQRILQQLEILLANQRLPATVMS